MTTSAEQFWQFALRFYKMPEVETSLLQLQDQDNLDVCYLLFILWHAESGRGVIASDTFVVLQRENTALELEIVTLRQRRRQLKATLNQSDDPAQHTLYAAAKQAELSHEQRLCQQLALYALAPAHSNTASITSDAQLSFSNYLHSRQLMRNANIDNSWTQLCAKLH